jgi:hypothetical protein
LWLSLATALLAGIFGGIVGPFVGDRLQRSRWKAQKRFDLKYEAFTGALNALAAWEADALDANLQSNKIPYKGAVRQTELRPSTAQALQHYNGMIQAHFSSAVATAYDTALKGTISIENVPYLDFETKRTAFINAASSELGLKSDGRVA